jgi:hypothetical protein
MRKRPPFNLLADEDYLWMSCTSVAGIHGSSNPVPCGWTYTADRLGERTNARSTLIYAGEKDNG